MIYIYHYYNALCIVRCTYLNCSADITCVPHPMSSLLQYYLYMVSPKPIASYCMLISSNLSISATHTCNFDEEVMLESPTIVAEIKF